MNNSRKRLAMAVEEHRDQIIMNEGKIKAQVAWNSAFDEVKQARANAATNPGALADADAKFALATHDLATATNPMFEAEAAKEAQGKSTVVTDPGMASSTYTIRSRTNRRHWTGSRTRRAVCKSYRRHLPR